MEIKYLDFRWTERFENCRFLKQKQAVGMRTRLMRIDRFEFAGCCENDNKNYGEFIN
jgi:hypothetical protein